MGRTLEENDGTWEHLSGSLMDVWPQLTGERRKFFFRLARKRAEYFADVEDVSDLSPDEQPTQHDHVPGNVIEDVSTQPESLPRAASPGCLFIFLR